MKIMKNRKESEATSHFLNGFEKKQGGGNLVFGGGFYVNMEVTLKKGKTLHFEDTLRDTEVDCMFICYDDLNEWVLKFIKKSRIDLYNVHRR